MRMASLLKWLCVLAGGICMSAYAAAPVVSGVSAAQRADTNLVDITYDVSSPSNSLSVTVTVSTNNGVTYDLPATSFSGAGYGSGVTPGTGKQIVWDVGADWYGQYSTSVWFRITADDSGVPAGMVLIPAGSFTMGDTFSEGDSNELPTHSVSISAFYMDKYEVSKALWDLVYQWATNNGYAFSYAGSGKASTHPVRAISWYDCVRWCNARSEKDGLTPCYYTSAAQSAVYRTNSTDIASDCVKWSTNGYRLPTEAEWEKAARGGVAGHRFPWSDADTITHDRANYYSTNSYSYDVSSTRGYHPTYKTGASPYTSPVGVFAANGYGLYSMAGNVFEWCWDWHDSDWYNKVGATQADTRGPSSGASYRVVRSGRSGGNAFYCRSADRFGCTPDWGSDNYGFRCARSQ